MLENHESLILNNLEFEPEIPSPECFVPNAPVKRDGLNIFMLFLLSELSVANRTNIPCKTGEEFCAVFSASCD
jgi:hypothetical protein